MRSVTPSRDILDFYATPTEQTSPGRRAALFQALPDDVDELMAIVQGLFIYDVVANDYYDFQPPKPRLEEIHVRSVEAMLEKIRQLEATPLFQRRPVEQRMVARCDHFVRMLIAMLRDKGAPARARCGFGAYFNPPKYEDHWVCEWWNEKENRWQFADPQFDAVWRRKHNIRHDTADVPRDQFLIAAQAWKRCRAGKDHPDKYGITFVNLHGLWYIAGNLVRDVAALNGHEVLPWDFWGAAPKEERELSAEELAFFDRLADLTAEPDRNWRELRERYQSDERLTVPAKVFNSLRQKVETV
jgi:hypothetical protein